MRRSSLRLQSSIACALLILVALGSVADAESRGRGRTSRSFKRRTRSLSKKLLVRQAQQPAPNAQQPGRKANSIRSRLPKVSTVKNQPAVNAGKKHRYTVASFNVENLFAYRPGQPAPQGKDGRKPPRYLPKDKAQYQAKLAKVAKAILVDMKHPEVVALQEIENRKDVDVLKDLSGEIKRQASALGKTVDYGVARVAGSSDNRGIGQGFLYRKDRVTALKPKSHETKAPQSVAKDGEGRTLMRRPLLVGGFEIHRDGVKGKGPKERIYIVNQHLKSRPDSYVERRAAQAKFSGEKVQALLKKDPKARVIVAGDFNVDINQKPHKAQMKSLEGLGKKGLLSNLTSRLSSGERFSYLYKGRPQLLDWMYATKTLDKQLVELRIPHINSPESRGKRASDHDPVLATFAGRFE